MIPRTIFPKILESIEFKPVTLIAGARQTGKTTLCRRLSEELGMRYVSLASVYERDAARTDPAAFLRRCGYPLIIDEVQYAPVLFEYIEEIVDREAFDNERRSGLFVLACGQMFNLMAGVTQSMAGRVAIIDLSTLSLNEIAGRREEPFIVDCERNRRRAEERTYTREEVVELILRGGYPELHRSPGTSPRDFFADYVTAFIEKDVSQLVGAVDESAFLRFLNAMGSLTRRELAYGDVAEAAGIDAETAKSWTSALETCGIVHFLQPYCSMLAPRKMTGRPKMYFWDTGLACFLTKAFDAESLDAMHLMGQMAETLMIDEIMKSYVNTRSPAGLYRYGDSEGRKVDLMIERNGKVSLIECRPDADCAASDAEAFAYLKRCGLPVGPSCVMCLCEKPHPIGDGVVALPISSIRSEGAPCRRRAPATAN